MICSGSRGFPTDAMDCGPCWQENADISPAPASSSGVLAAALHSPASLPGMRIGGRYQASSVTASLTPGWLARAQNCLPGTRVAACGVWLSPYISDRAVLRERLDTLRRQLAQRSQEAIAVTTVEGGKQSAQPLDQVGTA
jgi:hypothetical protein